MEAKDSVCAALPTRGNVSSIAADRAVILKRLETHFGRSFAAEFSREHFRNSLGTSSRRLLRRLGWTAIEGSQNTGVLPPTRR
jgi:hypothetical protein